MPSFPIIDTHVHLWDPKNLRYPWLDSEPLLNRRYLVGQYDQTRGDTKLEAMVFVECAEGSGEGIAEAQWVAEIAESEPRIQGIVAHAPLERGDAVLPALEKLAEIPLVRGVRRIIQYEDDIGFCLREKFIDGVNLLPRFGFSFDICVAHHQIPNVVKMVDHCPEVSFMLDHIGKPDIKNGVMDPWKKNIATLSEFPNTWCKISGLVVEADHQKWTASDLAPYIEHVIKCFGYDRVVFGGDWPVILRAAEVSQWIEALDVVLTEAKASPEKLSKLYRDNAAAFYRLK